MLRLDAAGSCQRPRFASFALRADCADELGTELQKILPTDTTASWLKRLHAFDLIADRILSPSEWVANEQVEATFGSLRTETPNVGEVVAARTPGKVAEIEGRLRPAPNIGQDTVAILAGGWS